MFENENIKHCDHDWWNFTSHHHNIWYFHSQYQLLMIISSVPKLLTGLSSPGDPSWSNIDRGNPLGGIMPMIIDFPDLLPFIFLEYFSSRFLLLWFLPWVLLPRRDSCMGKWTFINQENIFGEKRFFVRKKNFGIDPILQCWLMIYFGVGFSLGP